MLPFLVMFNASVRRSLWRGSALAVALLFVFGLAPSAFGRGVRQHRRQPLVADLQVSAVSLRPGTSLVADVRLSRLPRGQRLRRAVLSFGDGSRSIALRRLRTVTHRYRRSGRYVVTFRLEDAGGQRRIAHARVVVGHDLAVAVTRPGVEVASDHDVARIAGSSSGVQTVRLGSGAVAPAVGAAFVLPASAAHPDGVLGIVTHEGRGTGGGTTLQLRPATLDAAYRQVHVNMQGTLGDKGVLVTHARASRASSAVLAQPASTGGGATFHLGGSGISCTGPGAGPQITSDLDLTALHWQLSFVYPEPEIHFLVTGSPTLKLGLGLAARAACHLSLPLHVVIPIPGTPLELKISPIFQISASGALSASWTWSPRLTFGFDRGSAVNDDARVFNPGTTSFDFDANADADVFLGLEANLSLAGRVGVSADLGPDFTIGLKQTPASSCLSREVGLKIAVSANADLFVKHWSFAVASATLFGKRWPDRCNATKPTTSSSSNTQTSSSGSRSSDGGAGAGGSGTGNDGSGGHTTVTALGPTSGPAGFGLDVSVPQCSVVSVAFDGYPSYSISTAVDHTASGDQYRTQVWTGNFRMIGSQPLSQGIHQVSFSCVSGGSWTDPGFAIDVTSGPADVGTTSNTVAPGGTLTFTSGASSGPSPCPALTGYTTNSFTIALYNGQGQPTVSREIPLPDNASSEPLAIPASTPPGAYSAVVYCTYTSGEGVGVFFYRVAWNGISVS